MRFRLPTLAFLTLALLASAVADATTIVPAADPGELALDSQAVFLARAGASTVVERSGYLATTTELEVVEVVKGPLEVGDVTTTITPGGARDGVGWAVAGAPILASGETYLFFADRGQDGLWRSRLMAESVLRRATAEGGIVTLVPLAEARQIERMTGFGKNAALVPGPVEERRFIDALRKRVGGVPGWSWSNLVVLDDGAAVAAKVAPSGCVFMTYPEDNLPIRWRKFDNGGSQTIAAESAGDPLLPGGGFDELQSALSRWNAVSSTSLSVGYGGATAAPPATCTDNTDATRNAVIFDDPCDELPDLSNCSGTLAHGGPSFYTSSYSFDGQQWHEAVQWFVVVNNGTGDCLSSTTYELMLTHELGHGLGFGHVADPNALMYANCCNPHTSLDNSCAQYLYPLAAPTPTATPTATPTPTPTSVGPTATPTPTPTPTPTATPPTPSPTPTPTGGRSATVMVPVVVHDEGEGGTSWRSDVVVTNRNPKLQQLRFTYFSSDKARYEVTRTLPAFATLLLEDLVKSLFGAGDGKGPLTVEVLTQGTEPPVVVSRAYSENTFGNLGSGLPADVTASTAVVAMPGLFSDDELRSNIAVTADAADVVATFDLYRGSEGMVTGGVTRKIEAGEQKQWSIAQLFRNWSLDGVPMTVRVSLSQPGIAFASLVDNASTDSVVYLGKEPARTWVVPVVAHLSGEEGTFWSSSVAIWNAEGTTTTVDLEYLPEKTDNSDGGLRAALIYLGPHTTRNLDDVLYNEFGIDDGKGVLVVDGNQPITVTSRVFTDGPQGGTSGNGVRTVPVSAMKSGTAVLPGVRMVDGYRTNVGFVTGGQGTTFTCKLYDSDGTLRKQGSVTVPAWSLKQRSVEQIFGGSGYQVPDPVGMITVESAADFLAYLTVIDGTAQDPIFVMPQ